MIPREFPEEPEIKHLRDIQRRVKVKKQHQHLLNKDLEDLRMLLAKFGASTSGDISDEPRVR